MSYGRIISVVAVAALGAALVLGCGDGSEASSDVTKAEFTKEAETVCRERKEDWDAEVAAFSEQAKAEGETDFDKAKRRSETFLSASLVPLLQEELGALEDLGMPEADEAKIEKMLQSRARGIERLEEDGPEALLGQPFREFEREAKAYGLSCSPLI